MTKAARTSPVRPGLTSEVKFVIFASSLGTIFEWYDFYLYAMLAPFFASLFFPTDNDVSATLAALATYTAEIVVRPFGAIAFGRLADLVGRRYVLLVTIMMMGTSTFLVGFLPPFTAIGWTAPILLVTLRLLQGFALGGEYGSAATYVAEHSRPGERGYTTSWIQTTATVGLLLALIVIGLCREFMDAKSFATNGWRIPFVVSVIQLIFSLYIRCKLNESPIFQRIGEEGKGSKAPVTESFRRYPNNKYVLLALLGATIGQGVVWYTGQFYALCFLTVTLKLNDVLAYVMTGVSLIIGTPFFIFFGWLSDRIGRLRIILAGCLIAAVTYFPLFAALTHYVNPELESFTQRIPIMVTADPSTCEIHVFVTPFTAFSTCDKAMAFVTKLGLSFTLENQAGASEVTLTIGSSTIKGFDAAKWNQAFLDAGYPNLATDNDGKIVAKAANSANINWLMSILIVTIMVVYVAMVCGPIAAYLVELFPTRIRCTSMSLPYHVGNGWFGGMLPPLATAFVAARGDIYYGLWYPFAVSLASVVIGGLFLRDTKDVDIVAGSGVEAASRT